MSDVLVAGGCSFTFGNELSDDDGINPSKMSWAALLSQQTGMDFVNSAKGGLGNSGIARRVFNAVSDNDNRKVAVTVMWTFPSRYDWAMPRHNILEDTRWATITPWDCTEKEAEVLKTLIGNDSVIQDFKKRRKEFSDAKVTAFADSLYKNAANRYHETYLSWKSIVWLQNILEKKKIPFMFTLADNTLFWEEFELLYQNDKLLKNLLKEIDFTKWFTFGDRHMGFNQWALLNDYPRASTHPLDQAHKDAIMLMLPEFKKIIGEKNDQMD
jgi:hypothetical protein